MRRGSIGLVMAGALALACGSSSKKGPDTEALCAAACDNLNACQAQLHTDTCVAKTYVPDCKAAIDGGDAAKKTEVSCLSTAACADAPKCLGNTDPCAGVTCDPGKICNPSTVMCDKPNCQFRIQGQDCLGDQVCIGPKNASGKVTNGFCSPVLPRTYVFHFGSVELTPTNNGMPWRTDGTLPDLKVGADINGVTAHTSSAMTNTLTADFTSEPSATFSIPISSGDAVTVGVYDATPDGDRLLTSCVTHSDEDFATQFVRPSGVNCSGVNDTPPKFFVEIHPQ